MTETQTQIIQGISRQSTPIAPDAQSAIIAALEAEEFGWRLEGNAIVITLPRTAAYLGLPVWDCGYIWREQDFWNWSVATERWFLLFTAGDREGRYQQLRICITNCLKPYLESDR